MRDYGPERSKREKRSKRGLFLTRKIFVDQKNEIAFSVYCPRGFL